MCKKLILLTSFLLVLGLVGSASAALPEGWQSQDIGTTDGSADESDGMWIITADGADVWGSADEFHYAYVPLSGDGTIIAQVISNGEGSNGWAKGGVMIRETLDADSKHSIMALTGGEGGGITFQGRPVTGERSNSMHDDITASPPHWVKLTRVGNTITAYHSADGVDWALFTDTATDGDITNPIDVEMAEDVYIGLFVTSHASGELRTYLFDNVSIELPIPVTDPDLLIYYDFESGAGEMAIDRSGHNNHGLFMGNPEWATGIFGGALAIQVDEVDYIETVAPLNIVTNTVTVTGWVKHDETPVAWSGILTHRGTTPGCLGLQHNGVELRYMWGADVYWDVSSGLEMPNGEWYFAAIAISPEQGKFYLNGLEQTFTNVAPHEPTNFDSTIYVGGDIDNSTDRIMTSLIDEVRFYNRTLTDVEIQRLLLSDVTAPGDIVKGVPDDGDWPGAETPPLAIDDNTGTKYLHFKGETETTGFQVTPLDGPSIVTGLTFTTANDAEPRDPVSFELSGSNESIDGPYDLIASGDIVDFAQETAWPRFTKNETPISFDNDVAYAHYQVLFPAVRDAGSANSMQIAEVELLGTPLIPTFEDDFESYNDSDKIIFETWLDGTDDPLNGSIVGYEFPPFAEQTIVHGGLQSMPFSYNNTSNVPYSEARRIIVDPQDWTDYEIVSLYVHGEPDNDLAPIYLRLTDNQGTDSVVYNPNLDALNTDGWTELLFPLMEFANMDVNLREIKEVSIGIGFPPAGLIHFPSIELLQSDPPCGYCSYNGVVYIDDAKLQRIGAAWEELYRRSIFYRCLLTGCVFDSTFDPPIPIPGATVTLVPTSGGGQKEAVTCPVVGRYLMNPIIAEYNVTVKRPTGAQFNKGVLNTLQPGLNEVNFSLP